MPSPVLRLAGETASLHEQDGASPRCLRSVQLGALTEALQGSTASVEVPLLPEGTRYAAAYPKGALLLIEQPPQVRQISWRNNTPEDRHGGRVSAAQIALPYAVFFVPVVSSGREGEGAWYLQEYASRLFFRTSPLATLQDPLLLPALTHVWVSAGQPRSVGKLCMRKNTAIMGRSVPEAAAAAVENFWGATFQQYVHDAYWGAYCASRHLDPRISSYRAWEKATKADPAFVFQVPWQRVEFTPRAILDILAEESFRVPRSEGPPPGPPTLSGLIDLVMQLPEQQEERHA